MNDYVTFRGGIEMLTVAYVGEGGVKNCQNYAYVIYGCPHSVVIRVMSRGVGFDSWLCQ